MLSCAAFSAGLGTFGTNAVIKAMATAPSRGTDRILRITRNVARQGTLLTAKEVQSAIRLNKGRHIVISLQSRTEYDAGHVPGALLLEPENLSDPASLEAFVKAIPPDKSIILTCSNGHMSCAAMLFLRQLGLDASAMAFGMYGWNRAYAGSGAYQGDIAGEISTSTSRLPLNRLPVPEEYSELGDRPLVIGKSVGHFLFETRPTQVRDKPDDQMLICLRRAEDYAAGHIPGAINISSEAFYSGDRIILQIPRDRKIVLSCYVGHFSAGAALLLNQLGYNACSLEWGMAGWNNKYIGPVLNILQQGADLPVEHGPGADFILS